MIDPACGSGHFLLAAARRIATRLARIRAEGTPSLTEFRHALRDVARHCIYGVDRNPMAVELTKVALWIETVDPGLPLGFFDAQIRCGDSLLGVFDLETLEEGIPDAAYKPLIGDDKDTATYYRQANQDAKRGQGGFNFSTGEAALPAMKPLAMDFSGFRELPEDTVGQIDAKAARYRSLRKNQAFAHASLAADLYIAAFLLPKCSGAAASASTRNVPTTEDVWLAFDKGTIRQSLTNAPKAARQARAFHWPLEFPDVMVRGGFDVVLGNPPWEKYTILEREFFSDLPEISGEPNAALRRKLIKSALESSKELSAKWEYAQREAQAKGEFVRKSNRFPEAGVGELNLYPLFAELACSAVSHEGIIGIVLKSMMFTGSTWKGFTDQLITSGRLYSVFDFKNWEMLFSSVGFHERFSLVTIGTPKPNSNIELSVGLTNPSQLGEQGSIICVDRQFPRQVNPNTGTLPQCETARDIQILSRIAGKFPTLGQSDWNARYTTGLHMTGDAAELHDREKLEHSGYELHGSWFIGADECFAPVYEGKLIHQYDHRFATFDGIPREKRFGIKAPTNIPSEIDKTDRDFELVPRYWISHTFYEENTRKRKINENWNIAFRDTTNVISNFRTAVGCIVGPAAYSYKCPNIVIGWWSPRLLSFVSFLV